MAIRLTITLIVCCTLACAPGHGASSDDDDNDHDNAGGDADSDSDGDADSDADSDSGDSDPDGGDNGTAFERCDDQLDNDRDGLVDEDCACEIDLTQPCYTGTAATRGVGPCQDGEQTCEDHIEFPSWGACSGVVLPQEETCEDQIDNDCDGRADEGCGKPDCEVPEFTQEQDCDDGFDEDCDELTDCEDSDCSAQCGGCQAAEVCNDDIDNDCNELIDCMDPACRCGGDEICDGVDNNGDGRIDEGRACGDAGDGNGDCPPGAFRICDAYCGVHQICSNDRQWGPCTVDSTCDGVPECAQHSDCPRGYYCDYGSCSPGTMSMSPCESDDDCDAFFGLGPDTCQVDQGVCISDCYHHDDCGQGHVCDLGQCVQDPYVPGQC